MLFDIAFINNRQFAYRNLIQDGIYDSIDKVDKKLVSKVYKEMEKRLILKTAEILGNDFSEESGTHTDENTLICEVTADNRDYSDVIKKIFSTEFCELTRFDGIRIDVNVYKEVIDELYGKEYMTSGISKKFGCSDEFVVDIYNSWMMSIFIHQPEEDIMKLIVKTYNND